MSESAIPTPTDHKHRIFRVALTGGPCGGKTTLQSVLSDKFENLGWKVYRVPETSSVLLLGGVLFSELNEAQVYSFQLNLLKTMLQIEDTYYQLALRSEVDTLIICDRGAMDPSAYIDRDLWLKMLKENNWNEVELRDSRYDCVLHLMSAANGAEKFYCLDNNATRTEGLDLARELDNKVSNAWVGHPYLDVVDNSTGFDMKKTRAVGMLCKRAGVTASDDPLSRATFKRKFLLKRAPSSEEWLCAHHDFDVVHDYVYSSSESQARVRRRGQNGVFSYQYTLRQPKLHGQNVEVKRALSRREYQALSKQVFNSHFAVYKTRQCFLYGRVYGHVDIYQEPCHERCKGLVLLEVYLESQDITPILPPFLEVVREVTNESSFSMWNLSKKDVSENMNAMSITPNGDATINGNAN